MIKKKILFIGHDYHKKTKSADFMITLLKKKYNSIEAIYIDPYSKSSEKFDLKDNHYDVVVFWQIYSQDVLNKISYRKIIFFPMYDECGEMMLYKWHKFKDTTIISFSETIYNKLKKYNFDIHYFQFFIKPLKSVKKGDKKSCFFWQRRNEINYKTFKNVMGDNVDTLYYHDCLDPGVRRRPLPKTDDFKIVKSTWFEKREDLTKTINKSLFYFAPRKYEGIGMSFLEAMAMNRIVIAPNRPTMNEYIKHGYNGFLYKNEHQKIDISKYDLENMQKNISKYIKEGYKKWSQSETDILSIMGRKKQKVKLSFFFYLFCICEVNLFKKIVRALYQKKITKSGVLSIKICKIPVYRKCINATKKEKKC